MNAYIYFKGATGVSLDEIEEALDRAFMDRGEVTGSGLGPAGSNIDLEIFDDMPADVVRAHVDNVIQELGIRTPVIIEME